jgi:hypothetical protein
MSSHPDAQARRQAAAQIMDRLRAVVPAVLAGYPVDAAYVYGSVARGTVMPFSDVDVALLLTEVPPPYECMKLEFDIQAAIEDASGLTNLDVRTINDAPLSVQANVVQDGILVYDGDHDRRVTFEVYTRKMHFDFAPVAKRLSAAFLDKIRREGILHG